jgi:hypothetical protein
MGEKIQVKEQEAEIQTDYNSEHWLDRILKEEPASFAE